MCVKFGGGKVEFSGEIINEAILLVAMEKRGYVKELMEKLKSKNLVKTEDEANKLITILGLMGYLAYGLTSEYKESWKATKLALEEKRIYDLYQRI